jgi:hypothetical protein
VIFKNIPGYAVDAIDHTNEAAWRSCVLPVELTRLRNRANTEVHDFVLGHQERQLPASTLVNWESQPQLPCLLQMFREALMSEQRHDVTHPGSNETQPSKFERLAEVFIDLPVYGYLLLNEELYIQMENWRATTRDLHMYHNHRSYRYTGPPLITSVSSAAQKYLLAQFFLTTLCRLKTSKGETRRKLEIRILLPKRFMYPIDPWATTFPGYIGWKVDMFQLLFELYRFLSIDQFKVAFTLMARPMEVDAEGRVG